MIFVSIVKNKNCKEEMNVPVVVSSGGGGGGQFNGPVIETRKKVAKCCNDLKVQSPRVEEINHHDSDSESSPSNSPTSSISRENDSGTTYTGSSSSSTSSFSSRGGCFSGSISEEEDGNGDEDEDDGCLDDWEAAADALVGAPDANQGHYQNANLFPERETTVGLSSGAQHPSCENVDAQVEILKSDRVGILGRGSENGRAWRPDDAFRPQSLPNLAKQRSFPSGAERLQGFTNPWGRNTTPRVPTSCPICCEDLDLTDSSFLPCPCGFHLCLFCHKRILEADARCPGCRKEYASEPLEKEASVSGGSLTIRLARSCSMSCSRV